MSTFLFLWTRNSSLSAKDSFIKNLIMFFFYFLRPENPRPEPESSKMRDDGVGSGLLKYVNIFVFVKSVCCLIINNSYMSTFLFLRNLVCSLKVLLKYVNIFVFVKTERTRLSPAKDNFILFFCFIFWDPEIPRPWQFKKCGMMVLVQVSGRGSPDKTRNSWKN